MSKLAWCEIITGSMSVMWWARLQTALPTCHETQCHRETRHADSVIKLSPTLSHRSWPSRGIDTITDSGIMTQLSFDASSHDGWSCRRSDHQMAQLRRALTLEPTRQHVRICFSRFWSRRISTLGLKRVEKRIPYFPRKDLPTTQNGGAHAT